jgi:hypothetical protein
VRRLPLLVSGMLALPLALLPVATAAAGDAVEEPTPSVSASATAEPEPEVTEEPEVPEEPGNPEEPEFPDILTGVLTRSPASGPAGTAVKVASEDACVDGEGDVGAVADVLALDMGNFDDVGGLTDLARLAAADEDELDFGFVEEVVETDEDGAWETTLTIPESSEPGDVYMIIAACFTDAAEVTDEEAFPFLVYEPLDFTVTGAPEAPVAEPVPGDPSFTG